TDDASFIEGGDDDPDILRFADHFKPTRYTPCASFRLINPRNAPTRPDARRSPPADHRTTPPRCGFPAATATTAAMLMPRSRRPSPVRRRDAARPRPRQHR